MKTIDEGDAHHVREALKNALSILEQAQAYEYDLIVEIQKCKESIKIMDNVIAGIVK